MIDLTKPRTRLEALNEGLSKYFTGKPCTRGHTDYRYTNTGACSSCMRLNRDKYKTKMRDGYMTISIRIHREDRQRIVDFIHALDLARKIQNGG